MIHLIPAFILTTAVDLESAYAQPAATPANLAFEEVTEPPLERAQRLADERRYDAAYQLLLDDANLEDPQILGALGLLALRTAENREGFAVAEQWLTEATARDKQWRSKRNSVREILRIPHRNRSTWHPTQVLRSSIRPGGRSDAFRMGVRNDVYGRILPRNRW